MSRKTKRKLRRFWKEWGMTWDDFLGLVTAVEMAAMVPITMIIATIIRDLIGR